MMKKNKTGIAVSKLFIYIILVILAAICILPIWIVLINATRNTPEIAGGISLLPSVHFRSNWDRIMRLGVNLLQGYRNSATITVSVTVLSVYFSMLAAYAIEIYDFKIRKLVYVAVMVLIMIPGQVSIIGFVQYVNALGLMNSYIPLIVPAIAAPGTVFFCKQYLESCVIHDLIHAARIDGASEIGIFHRIMMPIAAPGAFTISIFTFVGSWNNLFLPFMILNDKSKLTIPILVKEFRGNPFRVEYGAVYLGIAVTILPVIVVYAFLSRFIVNGIAMGAVKE
jgi:multiple sugar transport system permease protein